MKKHLLIPSFILLSIALAGCLNNNNSQKTTLKQNKTANQANTPKKVSFEKAEDIKWVEADQSYVFTNTPTQITITSEIKENPNLISEDVYLYKCDADGNPTENLGRMFDDGTHGDLLADDNRFTTQITFNEKEPKEIKLRLILSYTNAPEKFQSDTVAIQAKIKAVPEEIRAEFIGVLKTGSKEDIMKFLAPGEVAKNVISSLTEEQRSQLIDLIKKAEFVKEIENIRHYQYLSPNGKIYKLQMVLTHEGNWVFIIY